MENWARHLISATAGAILGAAVIYALASGVSVAQADDYPTELDFQVAYCDGAARAGMAQARNQNEPPEAVQVIERRRDHFKMYLLARGYLSPGRDPTWILLAEKSGEKDVPYVEEILGRCSSACPMPSVPENQRAEAFDHTLACIDDCSLKTDTSGRVARLRQCQSIEARLPF